MRRPCEDLAVLHDRFQESMDLALYDGNYAAVDEAERDLDEHRATCEVCRRRGMAALAQEDSAPVGSSGERGEGGLPRVEQGRPSELFFDRREFLGAGSEESVVRGGSPPRGESHGRPLCLPREGVWASAEGHRLGGISAEQLGRREGGDEPTPRARLEGPSFLGEQARWEAGGPSTFW